MKVRWFSLLVTIFLGVYCYASDSTKASIQFKDTIILQAFTQVPKDIDGCGSYFSNSQKSIDKGLYFFVSSYDGVAYMKVSGSLIKLKCISTNRKPDEFYGDTGDEIYQGGGYKVWINFKYASKRDQEVWLYKGFIRIEHLNKKRKSQMKVIGETGC